MSSEPGRAREGEAAPGVSQPGSDPAASPLILTRRSFILALVGAGLAAGLPLPTGLASRIDAPRYWIEQSNWVEITPVQLQYLVKIHYKMTSDARSNR